MNLRDETLPFLEVVDDEWNKKLESNQKDYKSEKESSLKGISRLPFALLMLLCSSFIFADQYILGGTNGWKDVQTRNGITTGKGRFGLECLELASDSSQITKDSDLILNFENGKFDDITGNYSISENKLFITKKSKVGKGAAFSRNTNGGLVLSGNEGSLFGTEGPAGSFIIEFWLCPSIVENGETILNWRSSINNDSKITYQHITCSIYQNKLMTVFSNIFFGYENNNGDAVLYGEKQLIPGKWSHHLISYQENSGELDYRVDGELIDVKFITSTGHENGTIYPSGIGIPADLEICPQYTGLIDDIKITRSFENIDSYVSSWNEPFKANKKYNPKGGRFESLPILTKAGSIVESLTADVNTPPQTEVRFFIRGGDNYFSWTEDYPEWIQIKNGEPVKNLTGLYFQIAADLFPSGNGKESPSVTEITLNYTSLSEPQPPYKISAEKGDGSVTLNWSYSVDETTGGYYVYYGTESGEYLGRIAAEGYSPINAGNKNSFTITGLENGCIYYFAVSAWSKIDPRISGPLSKEVFARPER